MYRGDSAMFNSTLSAEIFPEFPGLESPKSMDRE
jgi:hypothetical protein